MIKQIIYRLLLLSTLMVIPFLAQAQTNYSYESYNHESALTQFGPPNIIFPVQGGATFSDDYGDARSGGRVHEANDLMAPKMTPVIAARGGTIVSMPTTEPSYGYIISIAGDDGYKYNYLHLNNDNPGTDDGLGGVEHAYAPDISRGSQVIQGQHIAWVGDSGNAEETVPHLHFEIRLPDDTAINPYSYLQSALTTNAYSIFAVKAASPTINHDKGLVVSENFEVYCEAGSLIRIPENPSVYYCGADGKRYVFPNSKTYATWYSDFSEVKTISLEEMSKISLGGNVTYRPGIKLVKIQTDPHVYAVDINGILRLILTPVIAEKYYGKDWNKRVEDIPDAFFSNYKLGLDISN